MHTLAPSVDRLGAALRALRQVHAREPESEDETLLGAQCLHVIITQLAEEGLQKEDLQPLIDLEASLRQHKAQAQGGSAANRRKHRPPSEDFLARIAAVIDLLVKGGSEEGEAAQMVMRRLMAAGSPRPSRAAMQGAGDVSWSGAPISATASSPPRRKKNTRTLRVSSKPSQPMSGSSACSTSISGTAGASQDSGANPAQAH